jgi:hypothetical protein
VRKYILLVQAAKRVQLGLDNLYVDMRQFCVANSNVKEAAALYQTITLMNTQRMQHQQKTS